ncbi:unnamed protein product, partial [Ectocarpus sp. 4 AP-2014]
PVFVVRDRVLFPGGLLRLSVGKPKSVRLVESLLGTREDGLHRHANRGGSGGGPTILVAIFTQRVGAVDEEGSASDDVTIVRDQQQRPGAGDGGGGGGGEGCILSTMSRVGCAAKVVQMGRVTGSETFKYSVLVQGVSRIRLLSVSEEEAMLHGTVVRLFDQGSIADAEVKALSLNLREAAQALLEVLKSRSHPRAMNAREILDAVSAASPGAVADVLASSINIPTNQKQASAILEETSLEKRLRRVLELVREQTRVLSIASKINSEVEGKLNSRHREYYLRQQLKAIRSELGEEGGSSEGDEVAALEAKLEAAGLPPEASKVAKRDLSRLKRMQTSQPEYTVIRTYLETVSELPWNRMSEETYDIYRAQLQLDKDHYGLNKVKQRIVEYIAVRSLLSDSKGSILCLVGPPGVGKTSLGRSIAAALNRKFQRLSLGGVHDEAEIRGHRRTYIGAMPGGIVRCLRRAGTRNPVMLLDEVDKIGSNLRGGDPSAALLEVLDPEQNDSFTDHYVNVPFDLSSVVFVATANKVDTIPEPLLDRLEVIHIPGYTLEEKVKIAEAYLIPKQMKKNGVGAEHMLLPRSTVLRVASSYTREAGVRQLERELAAVCRHVALKVGVWQQNPGSNNEDNKQGATSLRNASNGQTSAPEAKPSSSSSSSTFSASPAHLMRSRGSAPIDGSFLVCGGSICDGGVSNRSGLAERADAAAGAVDGYTRAPPAALAGDGQAGVRHKAWLTEGRGRGRGEIDGVAAGGTAGGLGEEGESARGEVVAAVGAAADGGDGNVHDRTLSPQQQQQQQQQQRQPPAFPRIVVTCEMLRGVLGPELYESEVAARVATPGTCTGLAWTPTGGELLFIECTSMPGTGAVKLTGKLGEVMQESAQIALSWIRSHEREICDRLGLTGGTVHATAAVTATGRGGGGGGVLFPSGFFSNTDLHLHVPAGGVSKDGPSAGVAITSALLSLLLGRAIDTAVAMTGEV